MSGARHTATEQSNDRTQTGRFGALGLHPLKVGLD
jgi:hypothetical protein